MTEEEAKLSWCPFSRAIKGERIGEKINVMMPAPVHNRYTLDVGDNKIPSGSTCLGSMCMAWRWNWVPSADYLGSLEPSETVGHCGLAGKP